MILFTLVIDRMRICMCNLLYSTDQFREETLAFDHSWKLKE